MNSRSPVAVFLAASTILATNAIQSEIGKASTINDGEKYHHQEIILANRFESDNKDSNGMGGLKEWTTDQEIDEESTLDKAAKKAKKKAKEQDYCIPIGEGENCW